MANWISVKDRLPPKITPVLVCVRKKSGNMFLAVDFIDNWDGEFFTYRHKSINEVTHWMILPDFPKEEL